MMNPVTQISKLFFTLCFSEGIFRWQAESPRQYNVEPEVGDDPEGLRQAVKIGLRNALEFMD